MTNSLKQRLIEATGPDRELADEVLLARGWVRKQYDTSGDLDPIVQWISPEKDIYQIRERPNPLASLDSALTLHEGPLQINALHSAIMEIPEDADKFDVCRKLCLDALKVEHEDV